jgi:hypothetical protein
VSDAASLLERLAQSGSQWRTPPALAVLCACSTPPPRRLRGHGADEQRSALSRRRRQQQPPSTLCSLEHKATEVLQPGSPPSRMLSSFSDRSISTCTRYRLGHKLKSAPPAAAWWPAPRWCCPGRARPGTTHHALDLRGGSGGDDGREHLAIHAVPLVSHQRCRPGLWHPVDQQVKHLIGHQRAVDERVARHDVACCCGMEITSEGG